MQHASGEKPGPGWGNIEDQEEEEASVGRHHGLEPGSDRDSTGATETEPRCALGKESGGSGTGGLGTFGGTGAARVWPVSGGNQ